MNKRRVALIDMGERLSINLSKLATKLNSMLLNFEFSPGDPITAARIGEPTIANEWHDVENLIGVLRRHSYMAGYEFLVGLTHYKITVKDSPTDSSRRDYFSLSDFEKISVLSLNDAVAQYRPQGQNLYQYAANLLMCELLIMLAKQDMMHQATNYCLFDDCEDRAEFRRWMKKGEEICTHCSAKLQAANISKDVIEQAKRMLRWCNHVSPGYVVSKTMMNPVSTLAIGTALGWAAKTFIPGEHFLLILIFLSLVVGIVYFYSRYVSQ